METQAATGTDTAHPQKPEAGGSENVSSSERAQRFLEDAKARRAAEAKPAKEPAKAPAKAPEETQDASDDEAKPEAEPEEQAQETQPEPKDTAPDSDDTDNVLSQFKLDPKTQFAVNKNLRRYADKAKHAIAERDAVKQEAAAVKAQLAQLQQEAAQRKPEAQAPAPVDPSDPAASINDEAGLVKLQGDARAMLLFYDRHRRLVDRAVDAGEKEVEIAGKAYEIEGLENSRELAVRAISESIPNRAKWLQEKQTYETYGRQVYPDAFDRNKADYQEAQGFLRANPEIARSSKADSILALVMRGKRALLADQQAATDASVKKKPPAEKPPDLGESSAPTAKVTARNPGGTNTTLDKEIREAQRKYEESGSMTDRTILERLKMRRK